MTAKQRAYVDARIARPDLSDEECQQMAGLKRSCAKNPQVIAALDAAYAARRERSVASADRIAKEIERIALYELDGDTITIKDKLKALDLLAKINGMYSTNQVNITVNPLDNLSDDELRKIAEC